VGPEAGVPCSACKLFVLLWWDVNFSLGVPVPLSQPQINQVNIVSSWPTTNQKIIRLNVTLDVPSLMHVLYPLNDLVSYHQHSFEGEFFSTLDK